MQKRRIVLTFPKGLVKKPIIYHLVADYKLVVNILRAHITPEEKGKLVLEVEGTPENIKKGLLFVSREKVGIQQLARDITFKESECISCGVCISVCSTGALSLDPKDQHLIFDKQKCILCELCVNACPLGLFHVKV